MKKYLIINHSIDFGNITLENNLKNFFRKIMYFYTFNRLNNKLKFQKSEISKFFKSFKLRKQIKKYKNSKIIFNSIGPASWAYGSYNFKDSILWIDWIQSLENYINKKKISKNFKYFLQKKILNNMPLILCRTHILKKHLIKDYKIDHKKIRILEAPFIFEKFAQKPNITSNKPKVLFIGKDFNRKGGNFLLENLKKIKDKCDITIISNIQKLSDVNVIKHVKFCSAKHLDILKKHDIFFFPSKFDPYGMVIPEAMSSSLAIITCKSVLGAQNYIKNNINGIICDKPDHCIIELEKLLENIPKINFLKKNAYNSMKLKHNSLVIKDEILKKISFYD